MVNGVYKKTDEEKTDTEKVLDFFVDLYKGQMGLRRELYYELKPLERDSANPKMVTYDLQVSHHDTWISRRITVGPIGEDTGSKSKCFLAIYDNKLVIKIPPIPVTDFEKYIESIEKERRIVEKLEPRKCIVPGVSVILEKIHKLEVKDHLSEEAKENAYLEWLRENPEYQEYLKIDDGFVFCMDLSEYVFLAEAIALFDPLGENIQSEILHDPSIIDDFEKFEGRYGLENAQIGMDLKSVYEEYEERVRKLMIQTGASPSVLLYKIQHWFFLHVAGKKVKNDKKDLTDSFVSQLNKLIHEIITREEEVVEEYRIMVRQFLQDTSFTKQKTRIEGIIANIMELLSWLRQKGVAMRDIKPDNLLVAGDPSRYPNFLSTPESYSIGLIDVETAVVFRPENGKIMQPLLGGTPFYATPSHMFTNKSLLTVYRDLPRILHLQDWFAVLAMIYGTIIGSYLFGHTAKVLVMLTKKIQKIKGSSAVERIIHEANKEFWRSAKEEFQKNMRKNEDQLRSTRAVFGEPVREMLIEELQKENQLAEKGIDTLIKRQSVFQSSKNREQLRRVSPGKMVEIIEKVKKGNQAEPTSLKLLEKANQLKLDIQNNRETIQLLYQPDTGFSVYNLLDIMFSIVYKAMTKGTRKPRPAARN